ncbi:probable cinnamyl alcohol dehydrogenase 9, partial [Camellia sinensis]|uniref:probable cinnamyl alcohol dehydrogenase 9 n=1 Tax=Camellia sinensis TaxID=4442 RepID=UPI001035DD15
MRIRNDVVFNGRIFQLDELCELIKVSMQLSVYALFWFGSIAAVYSEYAEDALVEVKMVLSLGVRLLLCYPVFFLSSFWLLFIGSHRRGAAAHGWPDGLGHQHQSVTVQQDMVDLMALDIIINSNGRKIAAESCIGGMKETQEMIDFVTKHNIAADIELIPMDYVNTAMERLGKVDVSYRFVIDVWNTLILWRKIAAESCIGGMKETQEMIDFVTKHNIAADIELIPMDYVNTAMVRLGKVD